MEKSSKDGEARQGGMTREEKEGLSQEVGEKVFAFLRPLLRRLDRHTDVRLVRTLASLVPLIVARRHRGDALLLSQLGDELDDGDGSGAGTKRIDRLIHSRAWRAKEIEDFLLEGAKEVAHAEAERTPEGRALLIGDGSVAEKPESEKRQGLAPVRSSKARRLRRPRPKLGKGYWRGKPGPPTVVPGWTWASLLVCGWAGREAKRPLALAGWRWYRRVAKDHPDHAALDGAVPTADQETAFHALLDPVVAAIGAERLLYVGDREFAALSWIDHLRGLKLPFVVRFKKGNLLRPEDAPSVGDPLASPTQCREEGVPAWRLTQRLLFRQTREIADPRHPKQPLTVTFGARPVRLVRSDAPLWLVYVKVGRQGRRRRAGEPWRLLTDLPLETYDDVWRVVLAYAARWQIEQMIRVTKSALGVESVRVRDWEPRQKLLNLVALAYAFLASLLADTAVALVQQILRFAHRRGAQANAWRPTYRLLEALALLWKRHTPSFQGVP